MWVYFVGLSTSIAETGRWTVVFEAATTLSTDRVLDFDDEQ